MGKEAFSYADRNAQFRKVNRFMVIGVLVFEFITVAIVIGSYINGHRSLGYLLAIAAMLVVDNIINFSVIDFIISSNCFFTSCEINIKPLLVRYAFGTASNLISHAGQKVFSVLKFFINPHLLQYVNISHSPFSF